jgi:hypothetical protein
VISRYHLWCGTTRYALVHGHLGQHYASGKVSHDIKLYIWYHNTTPQNSNLQVFKFLKKILWVFTRCVFTIPWIFKNKLKIQGEMKKENSTWIVSRKDKKTKYWNHIQICIFVLVYVRTSNLVLKIFGIANTHLVNTHNFYSIFVESCNFKF